MEISKTVQRPDVFSFSDYRSFLSDLFLWSKSKSKHMSFRWLARKTDLSGGYLKLVFSGQRNLAIDKVKALSEIFELKATEATYLEALYQWNVADVELKNMCFDRMAKLGRRDDCRELTEEEIARLGSPFVLPLLEAIYLKNFRNDSRWLQRLFKNRVSSEEIAKILETLTTMGVLVEKNGTYVAGERTLMIPGGTQVATTVLKACHKSSIPLGIESIDTVDRELREIVAASIAIPRDHIAPLKEKIRNFRNEILEYVNGLEGCEEVYQLNLQLFPLTDSEKVGE